MEMTSPSSFKNRFSLENLPYAFLVILFFLTPLFFVPSPVMTFLMSKILLVFGGVILTLMVLLVGVIKKGAVVFPKSLVLGALGGVSLVYLVAALFSSSTTASLFGYNFEISTFGSIVFLSVLAYLVAVLCKEKARLGTLHLVFFTATGILALYHIARFAFGADFLSFGLFTSVISNTLGKWNEVGMFFGTSTILSLLALEIVRIRKTTRLALYVLLIASLYILIAVNFTVIWYILGVVTLLLFVYQTVTGSLGRMTVVSSDMTQMGGGTTTETRPQNSRKIAYKPLAVLVIAIFFMTPIGQDVSRAVSTKAGVDNIEVRPSWAATFDIARGELKANPLLGSGPSRFYASWQQYRPDINMSQFWSTSFNSGIGFIPTALVETGILGLLSWLMFFAAFLYTGYRTLFVRTSSEFARYFVNSSFFASLFLWVMCIVYVPSLAMLALTFFFTGLFVAATIASGAVSAENIVFGKYQAASFACNVGAVVLLVLALGGGYVLTARMMSAIHFQKAIAAANAGQDIAVISGHLARSASISDNDSIYRAATELNLSRLNMIIAGVYNKSEVSEAERAEFQGYLERAVESGRTAVAKDPSNYENYVLVGNVYSTIVPLGVEGSYDAAKNAYESALRLSPRNPGIYLALARLEGGKGDYTQAEANVLKSLELKPNYVEAIFFQSQLGIAKGDLKKALAAAEQITTIDPNEPLNFFRLGLIKYEMKDYRGAAAAFERSISLESVYANAKYFLGLSYVKTNRRTDAIRQFEDLQAANPDNAEVALILTNLRAGRDPFEAAQAPIDNAPEKRDKLPIDE